MPTDRVDHEASGASTAVARRRILGLSGAGAAGLLLSACGGLTHQATSGPRPVSTATDTAASKPAVAAAQHSATDWLYLSIITGGMIHKKGWPEYVPGDFTVPAHSAVHVEIRCFDNGAAKIPASYGRVQGTSGGTVSVISAVNGALSSTKMQTVKEWDPKKVAHTLTITDIGLNIPVPALSTVRFVFATGSPGTHVWQCMSACGTGSSGWGGPMATNGWMKGTMTVSA